MGSLTIKDPRILGPGYLPAIPKTVYVSKWPVQFVEELGGMR